MSTPSRELTTTSYAILGFLAIRPWSTYELAKQMRRNFHYFWPRAESNLYAEPKRLISAGLVHARSRPVGRLTIVAEFDKPAVRVWQVWADPRQLERWWGPPTYPATVVDHDLSEGGRVTYYMTGPDGEKLHAWWHIISVDPPRSLAFEEGNADDSGPNDDPPSTSIKVRLVETPEKTTMTITCKFAPIADKEVPGAGTESGMRLAVGQIDAILATTTVS